ARPRQAQTDAHATAPRARDQTQPATLASAPPQAQLRSPREPKAAPAPRSPQAPPAALPQAAQGRSCAGSRGAQQHPHAQLPAPPKAEPPAVSCSAGRRLPAAPKTTADAAQKTTAPQTDARAHATPAAPHPHPPTVQPAPLPSALQTGCGSIARHQGSNARG